jgi:2-dehydropantoate 2-reductase
MGERMRYAVVGAGAIGAYVGAALVRGGAEVTQIARNAHLQAMRRSGVRVLSPRGDFHASVTATDDLDAVADADVVFLALKSPSLPAVAPQLARRLAPGAAVVAAQNGIPWWYFQSHPGGHALRLESVDPRGVVSRSIAPERVIGCVIYCSTEILEPGVIRHIEGTRYAIGEPDGSMSERCLAISEDFKAGGLKCPVDADLREQIWLKLLGNVAFNPVSALTGATLAELGTQPEMLGLLRAVMEESASIAAALGIELPVSIDHRLERGIAVGDHKTSMLQDVEAGKPLEIDCLTEAVIELADQLDIPVPHTRTLHACVTLLGTRACATPKPAPLIAAAPLPAVA